MAIYRPLCHQQPLQFLSRCLPSTLSKTQVLIVIQRNYTELMLLCCSGLTRMEACKGPYLRFHACLAESTEGPQEVQILWSYIYTYMNIAIVSDTSNRPQTHLGNYLRLYIAPHPSPALPPVPDGGAAPECLTLGAGARPASRPPEKKGCAATPNYHHHHLVRFCLPVYTCIFTAQYIYTHIYIHIYIYILIYIYIHIWKFQRTYREPTQKRFC